MNARKLQRQHRKNMLELFRGEHPAGGRVITTIKPVGEMLVDERFGEVTSQALMICLASAQGQTDHQQECFVCLQPWSAERCRESIGIAEFIERPNAEPTHVLTFAICWHCCFDKPAVLGALKRDFGDFTEFSNVPGRA